MDGWTETFKYALVFVGRETFWKAMICRSPAGIHQSDQEQRL
jgi:hypothetical protein